LRFLLGELRLAHARIGRGSPAMAGEDRAFLGFEAADGAAVGVLANLRVHGEPAALGDRLLIIGERGTIRLAGDLLSCEGEQPAEERFDMPACYLDSYAAAIAHFVEALSTGRDFETHPRDNLRTLQLVEEIYARSPS
jgi:predicted dehydrogenase